MTPKPRQDDGQETQSLVATTTNGSYNSTKVHDGCSSLELTMDEAIERLGYGRFQLCLFIATGLCMLADGLEVLLLSFLTLVLRSSTSHWTLTSTETSAITASVFAGAIFGALALGRLADVFGRKPIFVLTTAMVAGFGLVSGLAPNYWSLLACRFGVGLGVGGLTVPFVTLSEFLPKSHRGNNLLLIEFFWTAGSMMVVVLAYFTLGQGDQTTQKQSNDDAEVFWESWRTFVTLCAVPCVFALLWALWFVPESPRWLMTTKNDPVKALEVLRKAALVNGQDPYALFPHNAQLKAEHTGNSEDSDGSSGRFSDLFSPQWRRLTLFLWGTWFGFSFLYYGSVIATTMVFAKNSQSSAQTSHGYHFDYSALLISSSAEIVGNAIIVLTVDSLGRIKTQSVSYFTGGVTILLLCLLATSSHHDQYRLAMVILAFVTRMLMMMASCTTWVSTAEILPTHIRATGQSAANALSRLGGFVCPFIVGPSFTLREIGTIMFAIACGTAFCAMNLPETMGREMGAAHLDFGDSKDDDNTPKKPIIRHQETVDTASTAHSVV